VLIHLLPLAVDGAADLASGDIYLSRKLLADPARLRDCLAHEIAHLIVGHGDHNREWCEVVEDLGGRVPSLFLNTGDLPICLNVGNISGIQNILLDYHLLAAYRKFSQKILGTEGHWEVINEGESTVDGDSLSAKDQLIRLYPTPKGAFPVTVLYLPVVTHFRSPQARQLAYDLMVAEARIMIGSSRRKISGMPTPDGGSISYDGADMVQEGEQAREKILEQAINLGEPLSFWLWNLLVPLMGILAVGLKDTVC